MAEKKEWEYQVLDVGSFWHEPKSEELANALNELGQDGWEVISVVTQHGTNRVRLVAKRPLTEAVRRRRTWRDY